MRPSHRLSLIGDIARELDSRYNYQEIDIYFKASDIDVPYSKKGPHGHQAYVKDAIGDVASEILLRVAEDLEIDTAAVFARGGEPPKNWPDESKFRLFISHISKNKDKATRLRDCLEPYHISGFVAHTDIKPTLEWESEIERALRNMDAFLAIHTSGFSKSVWTQQEIGFAYAAGVKIISFKIDEDPTGFIGKNQALPRQNRTAEEIAKEVRQLLLDDPLTSARMIEVTPKARTFLDELDEEIPF
ncbi:MAG: toll/interleukin-1 receptor domain-containing protein [Hyphomicrobiaceae bacterium]